MNSKMVSEKFGQKNFQTLVIDCPHSCNNYEEILKQKHALFYQLKTECFDSHKVLLLQYCLAEFHIND